MPLTNDMMEKYKLKSFESSEEYDTWLEKIDHHEYGKQKTVLATTANKKRSKDNKIDNKIHYYQCIRYCKAGGLSKSGVHKGSCTDCPVTHKIVASKDGKSLIFDTKVWNWEHNHQKIYSQMKIEYNKNKKSVNENGTVSRKRKRLTRVEPMRTCSIKFIKLDQPEGSSNHDETKPPVVEMTPSKSDGMETPVVEGSTTDDETEPPVVPIDTGSTLDDKSKQPVVQLAVSNVVNQLMMMMNESTNNDKSKQLGVQLTVSKLDGIEQPVVEKDLSNHDKTEPPVVEQDSSNHDETEPPVTGSTNDDETEPPVVPIVTGSTLDDKSKQPVVQSTLSKVDGIEQPVVGKDLSNHDKTEPQVVEKDSSNHDKTEPPVVTGSTDNETEPIVVGVTQSRRDEIEQLVVSINIGSSRGIDIEITVVPKITGSVKKEYKKNT
ncbi:uncharacterized protein LOC122851836 [Aphidius gifuensis]|uniref:uncharacterized protein LOC122851836 n=1 Tax=Aphidius gifuensis TaxID=684658 RepID=UPI001CDC3D49|nr:uncharacterized protein LOC122851836 [Aphidius gifuensis]